MTLSVARAMQNMKAEFVVMGEPTGKARPRVTMHGTYIPEKTKDYERKVQDEYRKQCNKWFGENPIAVKIKAYYCIPKSATKDARKKMHTGEMKPAKKPDADNLAKAILDALNGIAYKDDAQVVVLGVEKIYSDVPRVEVKITDG